VHVPVPAPGTIVWIRQRRWRVENARLDRSVVRLDVVADRDRRLTVLAPFDRPALIDRRRRPKHIRPQHALARLAARASRLAPARGLAAAAAANVAVMPYQLEPALAILDGARRVLVADEVGLGKTIQAALAIAEFRLRRPSLRALVIVPRSLREQWLDELNGRCAIGAELADRETLEATSQAMRFGANPWNRPGVRVVSADYLKQPHVVDAIPLRPWDLVVIDEAHDACGLSARYEASHDMARRARHVLLLTATPHGGDPVRFARLLELGQLPGQADPLITFRRTRAVLTAPGPASPKPRGIGSASRAAMSRRVRWLTCDLSPLEHRVLKVLEAFERAVVTAAARHQRDGALLLLSIFRKRALSTMSALLISVERRLAWIGGPRSSGCDIGDWIQPRLDLEDPDEGRPDDECVGLTMESGLEAGAERTWLRRLAAVTKAAAETETKVRVITRLAARTREPVIVFTEFRHSLEAVERRLTGRRPLAVLHGGQSPAERRASLDRFRRGEADVLLATDVASQGLNLHERARWVVSLELAWTPSRLEQRVGRVDRIGQTRPVHASLVVARHPAESDLLARLAARALNVRRALADDALVDLLPATERGVANVLMTGAKTGEAAALPAIGSATMWRKQARAVARQIELRRALARRWRGPVEMGGRVNVATIRRSASLLGTLEPSDLRTFEPSNLRTLEPSDPRTLGRRFIVVITLPIVDRTGFVVDERLLSLAIEAPSAADALDRLESSEVAAWLRHRFAARLRRVRRLAKRRAVEHAAAERAVARHLMAVGWPEELQPGLFDRRAARDFEAARGGAEDIERDFTARLRALDEAAALQFGAVSIEVVFRPR
jgi:superfamily II DNA or RNA helicase